ncbi:MAG: hypothetical protein IJ212_02695 [Bacteroidaceae bacterium]|nr:hypothetical protein [Bacteroidaceae bacterium]
MGQTAYGVWATCVDPETITEEWNEWIKDDMEACPECYSGTMTDEQLAALLSRCVEKDGMYNFLQTDITGVAYDVLQMTSASDCGEYTVIYFSTEVAVWA